MAGRSKRHGAKVGYGGRRPGAGRKPQQLLVPADGPIPWARIQQFADAGVPERTILDACGLDEQKLRDAGELDRFRKAIAQGLAMCRAELQLQIKQRSEKAVRKAGSVNALALRARNQLEWDRHGHEELPEPDLSSAKERLKAELQRLALAQSQILKRAVSPADVLHHDATGKWRWERERAPR